MGIKKINSHTHTHTHHSQWSEVGITTDSVTQSANGKSYHVVCTTEHLTSFAVLVDVVETNVGSYVYVTSLVYFLM